MHVFLFIIFEHFILLDVFSALMTWFIKWLDQLVFRTLPLSLIIFLQDVDIRLIFLVNLHHIIILHCFLFIMHTDLNFTNIYLNLFVWIKFWILITHIKVFLLLLLINWLRRVERLYLFKALFKHWWIYLWIMSVELIWSSTPQTCF